MPLSTVLIHCVLENFSRNQPTSVETGSNNVTWGSERSPAELFHNLYVWKLLLIFQHVENHFALFATPVCMISTLHSEKISSTQLFSDTIISALLWRDILCHQKFFLDKFILQDRNMNLSALRFLGQFEEKHSAVIWNKSLHTVHRHNITWLKHSCLLQGRWISTVFEFWMFLLSLKLQLELLVTH